MKTTLRFDQISCRLEVEGLPDVSAGQDQEAVGIVTGWTLRWAGRPELEGRKEHLECLMTVVLPYARHLLSGVQRRFGKESEPVEIGPHQDGGHELLLRSSQPDTPPLRLRLDDAELIDLVRVLDQVRSDPRLRLELPVPRSRPLRLRELDQRRPLARRLAAPMGGAFALMTCAGLALSLTQPLPSLFRPTRQSSATPTATPNRVDPPGRSPGELSLTIEGESWLEVSQIDGTSLFAGIGKGVLRFPLGAGLKVRAGRPDLVLAQAGDGPARLLGKIDEIDWQRFGTSPP
ncbi:MAG: DUF4335 domain-containing protein [Cyanobacteriota bacterium]|jgi:hypothetical protein|nr:DUF4335 domain-containing protein [Cyanobacteriota bacterium]